MATQQQLDTVRKLHETDDRTLGGYKDGQYNIASGGSYMKEDGLSKAYGDPYELANAIIAGGALTPDPIVTGVDNGADFTLSLVGTTTGQVDSVVSYSATVGTGELTYVSDDEAVATVDSSGLVTAVAIGDGTAIITATSVEDGNFSGTTTVTVTA